MISSLYSSVNLQHQTKCVDKTNIISKTSHRVEHLEVLFSPNKTEPRLTPLITFDVECGTQTLRSAEEYTRLCRRVDFADGLENHVPVGAAEVCGCTKTCDSILLGVGVIDHDICCIIGFDFSSEVLLHY